MASLDIETLTAAARDLVRGGRWATAQRLLATAEPSDEHEAGALAVAAADTDVYHAFFTKRAPDETLLAAARARAAGPAQEWAADFTRLRASYAPRMFAKLAGEQPSADEPTTDDLAAEADRLAAQAPDPVARAYASFYQGLIAGVLRDEDDAAEKHWRAALDTDDEYVRSYALRHLGWVADEAGRHDEALEMWRESTRLRQQAGFVPGVLAQLVVQEGGVTPAVADWADALGIGATIGAVSTTDPEVALESA
jgi:tetratricopeptide (TPR) repeat protein